MTGRIDTAHEKFLDVWCVGQCVSFHPTTPFSATLKIYSFARIYWKRIGDTYRFLQLQGTLPAKIGKDQLRFRKFIASTGAPLRMTSGVTEHLQCPRENV